MEKNIPVGRLAAALLRTSAALSEVATSFTTSISPRKLPVRTEGNQRQTEYQMLAQYLIQNQTRTNA